MKILDRMIKIVLFDLGGVLLPSPISFWKELEKKWTLQCGSISQTIQSKEIFQLFQSLECGEITLPDFENLFTYFYSQKYNYETTLSILPIFSVLFEASKEISNYTNVDIDPQLQTAIGALRSTGVRVCIATNNFYTDRARQKPTLPYAIKNIVVDNIFESCKLGMRKPETQFYHYIIKTLKHDPSKILFIDDFGTNLKPALNLGFKTIKHNSIEATISAIEKIVGFSLGIYIPGTRLLNDDERIDEKRLCDYFSKKYPHEITTKGHQFYVRKFSHGQSNPTFYVSCCSKIEFVLRKKPSGTLLPTAHQIDREFRVQNAIRNHVPVPRIFEYVEGILDTPFYIMEYCKGRILTDPTLPGLNAMERKQIYNQLCDILLKIRNININEVGLGDFAPPTKYIKRNLNRFVRQYEASRLNGGEITQIESIINWLESNIPNEEEMPLCIVHGDFRLDNVVFATDEWRIIAVLDWELSTLGNPLTDLATCLMVFYMPHNSNAIFSGFCDITILPDGIPSVAQILHRYFNQLLILSTSNLSSREKLMATMVTSNNENKIPDWWYFYVVFVLFRNAVVLVGVLSRRTVGQASNPITTTTFRELATVFVKRALHIIKFDSETIQKDICVLAPSDLSQIAKTTYIKVANFIYKKIIPIECKLWNYYNSHNKWHINPEIEQLKKEAKSQGLWNLFITRQMDEQNLFGGAGLTTVEYAHICELMGHSLFAPEIFNCNAPDTGNMEVLIKYGSEKQQQKFLLPLLAGTWRSCFAMTEPDVASSDATNIQASIFRDNDMYVINGRKWFTSNALHPNCKVCIFMGKILNPRFSVMAKHMQQSMIIINFNDPGIKVMRALEVLGTYDAPGHAEVIFENVRVPIENLLHGEGQGFKIAQGRLGPGRIHHCMRLMGHAERALSLSNERISCRIARGKLLKDFQNVRIEIARSRIEIEQARLLVLKAAHAIDKHGTKEIFIAAAVDVAMIKVVAPQVALRVIDRAIQHFGAAGVVSSELPLSGFLIAARALRLVDGPDIVHEETIARAELSKSHI